MDEQSLLDASPKSVEDFPFELDNMKPTDSQSALARCFVKFGQSLRTHSRKLTKLKRNVSKSKKDASKAKKDFPKLRTFANDNATLVNQLQTNLENVREELKSLKPTVEEHECALTLVQQVPARVGLVEERLGSIQEDVMNMKSTVKMNAEAYNLVQGVPGRIKDLEDQIYCVREDFRTIESSMNEASNAFGRNQEVIDPFKDLEARLHNVQEDIESIKPIVDEHTKVVDLVRETPSRVDNLQDKLRIFRKSFEKMKPMVKEHEEALEQTITLLKSPIFEEDGGYDSSRHRHRHADPTFGTAANSDGFQETDDELADDEHDNRADDDHSAGFGAAAEHDDYQDIEELLLVDKDKEDRANCYHKARHNRRHQSKSDEEASHMDGDEEAETSQLLSRSKRYLKRAGDPLLEESPAQRPRSDVKVWVNGSGDLVTDASYLARGTAWKNLKTSWEATKKFYDEKDKYWTSINELLDLPEGFKGEFGPDMFLAKTTMISRKYVGVWE
ncbi:hypothetical protein AUEXF2481DRAFT_28017 [Aureobasidium subglaciale EXF-2481]|uniref:Uncharacterized protein n=1 Tax=Aureobasidium subglaciale (strain EXF-2481) TaxID=1043005 RepID=A0A074YLE8_AURSE|nr:uncharacterized protein AUEXF2481DRAFT_28017 [Aureobasidium subglaciale EXF-2481]KAI5198698.1 hypothetical protein E4T38_07415 [Aureobasidium subglaciale]KAI5217462.1 hypothetical protein E4T40_07426 [Aureobasidium subglaciale]KAI5221022.1 hypothetical protein E4T41_07267 [Aureobasidium subglaciale]KAI5258561.1 hypothetical protein E4T46_07244 [Aureobasidium subglaciale]KEQ96889.1 hypothetical protein AUEXF2481DRAFT_28017 [Aureobasidium subglaciale EXF-2481]